MNSVILPELLGKHKQDWTTERSQDIGKNNYSDVTDICHVKNKT